MCVFGCVRVCKYKIFGFRFIFALQEILSDPAFDFEGSDRGFPRHALMHTGMCYFRLIRTIPALLPKP